jgi:ppGpp synthetase/RelA/SpoT-type nucleotidyltranferase
MKPNTIAEYIEWAKTELKFDFNEGANKNRFDANLTSILNSIDSSDFLKEFDNTVFSWSEEYRKTFGSDLFFENAQLKFQKKSYDSIIDKTFRINVLWNKKFPDPPDKGWLTLDNIYKGLNDLVRSYLVCKFLDGPDFAARKLNEYCKSINLENYYYSQQRDEGYYAFHSYTTFKVSILDTEWQSVPTSVRIEIQFTTQLQDLLKNFTHQYFEETRLASSAPDNKWKWDIKSNRFKASYMSHTLHLLEAIIVELRDNSKTV